MTEVKTEKLANIKPDLTNANRHTERGHKMLRASMDEFGFAEAGTLDAHNRIIGGNHRTEVAADVLGADDAIVIETDGTKPIYIKRSDIDLTTERGKRLAYALNRVAQVSIDFDPEQVLADIEQGISLDGLFGQDEIDSILADIAPPMQGEDTEPEISRADELRQEWGTELGQLWALGEHRLICGDCTDEATVKRVMGGELAPLVFTDPPYNLAEKSTLIAAADARRSYQGLKDSDWDKGFSPRSFMNQCLGVLNDDASVYICTSQFLAGEIWEWMSEWSDFYNYVVWCKTNPMPSLTKRHWTWGTELICYATRGKHTFNFANQGHLLSWWDIKGETHLTDHPTEKPLAIPEKSITHSSAINSIVLDAFSGSGTTLIAAENLNRRCRAIEISPAYVAVTLQRFQDHTGIKPELIDTVDNG